MKKTLWYTFGNHMHWVDMQWLWGYGVLPGSVEDMLRLARETGAKGNVNFDGIGYEKMAAESPEALGALRAAVQAGVIEPVGCSYGQPYGLFHGGESNVRQLTYGARTVRRLLGVKPRGFWEEEFYFFPQLPQMLRGCGFEAASLFFQWTWHTPELPKEEASLVLWEGCDGSRIPALPRNGLNVHQWPEDFDGLLDSGLVKELQSPAIVQWLELMPSKDWMCRSEVLLPRLKELMKDARFEIKAGTLSEVVKDLAGLEGESPVRRYGMERVWHGMTLGKNGDRHPRMSRSIERDIQSAEAISSLAAVLGRPYASWDVYPAWELDEAWRELLSGQHHDNHECEGLCGFVGYASFERARDLALEVLDRTCAHIADRLEGADDVEAVGAAKGRREVRHGGRPKLVVFNPLPWTRSVEVVENGGEEVSESAAPPMVVHGVPGCGYKVIDPGASEYRKAKRARAVETDDEVTLTLGATRVVVDRETGVIAQIFNEAFPQGCLAADRPLLDFRMISGGQEDWLDSAKVEISAPERGSAAIVIERRSREGASIEIVVSIDEVHGAVTASMWSQDLPLPDAGYAAGLRTMIEPAFEGVRYVSDTPYAVEEAKAGAGGKRKYPEGDWMTSPQWFETVEHPMTGLTFMDVLDAGDARHDESRGGRPGAGRGVLVMHDGSQQYFATRQGVESLLVTYDPWDEKRVTTSGYSAVMAFLPHDGMGHAQRWKIARTIGFLDPAESLSAGVKPGTGLPGMLGLLEMEGDSNIVCTAVYRDNPKSGEGWDAWAGHAMRDASGAEGNAAGGGSVCLHPLVIRLVEMEGRAGSVRVKLPRLAGEENGLGLVMRTNLLGETRKVLGPTACAAPAWAVGVGLGGAKLEWSEVEVDLRPREIATVMADVGLLRKRFRDLDAKRKVWATVHKDVQ